MGSGFLGIVAWATATAIVLSLVLLFAGIGALVLIHVCTVGRVFTRGLVVISRGTGSAGTGLLPEQLEELPCYVHEAREEEGSAADCAVCLEGFQGGDKCRRLPLCGHSFHARCVDSWLMRSPVCPICRAGVDPRKSCTAPVGARSRNSRRLP